VTSRTYRSPRRAQAAAATRAAILDAAEQLFAKNGYACTTVTQVAAAAAVAPNTVYVSIGGKPQLIVASLERSYANPMNDDVLNDVGSLTDGPEIIRRLAADIRAARSGQHRAIGVMLDNAATEPLIADVATRATTLLRQRLRRVAERLTELAALPDAMTIRCATTILLFYFSFGAWRELRNLGWTWDDVEHWLAAQAIAALFVDPPASAAA
jgi:AcrR family transcriptional regulator